jgi:hypothetical protein
VFNPYPSLDILGADMGNVCDFCLIAAMVMGQAAVVSPTEK